MHSSSERQLLTLARNLFAALVVVYLSNSASAQNLSNVQLRCCSVVETPYSSIDIRSPETGNFSGLAFDYLAQLTKKTGLKCSSIKEYTSNDPTLQSFTGLALYFNACSRQGDTSNCTCDIGLGAWAQNSERLVLADFPAPYVFDAFQMMSLTEKVINRPKNAMIFFEAFEWRVWLSIVSLIALHIVVATLDRDEYLRLVPEGNAPRENGNAIQRFFLFCLKYPILALVRRAFYSSMMHSVGQTSTFELQDREKEGHRSRARQRFVSLITLTCGLFLLTVYGASVTSQLFNTTPVSPFRSIDDITSCKIPANRICFQSGGAEERFWNSALGTVECVRTSRLKPQLVITSEDGFALVLSGSCDYFYSIGANILSYASGKYCGQLSAVGAPFYDVSLSYLLPKNSSLTTPISQATLSLRDTNSLVSVQEFNSKQICRSQVSAAVNWEQLKWFFILAWVVLFSTLIVNIVFLFLPNGLLPPRIIQEGPSTATSQASLV